MFILFAELYSLIKRAITEKKHLELPVQIFSLLTLRAFLCLYRLVT